MPWFDRHHPPHHPLVRDHSRSPIVFLTVCSRNRKPTFARQEIADQFVCAWRDAGAWQVGRYVIMPDHVHLFCSPATCPPTRLDRWIAF
ncbi:MAG TPA: hypothetical protein VLW52_10035 [Opitutaceae bacterium]|nr:hypothetical protein [Opitutaceae bacterium]